MNVVHVVFTDYSEQGYGWDVTSPQVAGLSAGRSNPSDLGACVDGLLEFAGLVPGTYERVDHEQKFVESPNGVEYLIRFLVHDPAEPDDNSGVRGSAVGRDLFSASSGEMDKNADRMPQTVTGERLVIAVRRDDLLGWVLDQMSPGDGATLSHYAGDDAVWSLPIVDGSQSLPGGWTLDELHLNRDSTVGDLIDGALAEEVNGLSKVKGITAHLATVLV